jgi:hypothetical protein
MCILKFPNNALHEKVQTIQKENNIFRKYKNKN